MKKWEILAKFSPPEKKEQLTQDLIKLLLKNRKIISKEDLKEFLNPSIEQLSWKNIGIKETEIIKTRDRIKKALKEKEMVIVFGDYDVDGITGAAILWETLSDLGLNVMPYIPHRVDEGYGLSVKGIDSVLDKYPNTTLIVTVDNGVVANKAVEYANEKGLEVVITDHHVKGEKIPKAFSVVYTTKVCGAGVAWALCRYLDKQLGKEKDETRHLELVALATVADVMGLTGSNRAFARLGIDQLRLTKRKGLVALFKESAIDQKTLGVYEIGHIIAPRLNATGRLDHAIDSLRLICTKDPQRATTLSQKLSSTNLQRQKLTIDSFDHAKNELLARKSEGLIYIAHESYQPGVIGLIAGKLVEQFYRPAIVISKGELVSKGSARSVSGFNIVEFIRLGKKHLIDIGGHPMAAGFSLKTENIEALEEALSKIAKKTLLKEFLVRKLRIDCELPINLIDQDLYIDLQKLSPFGPGNPEPVFMAKSVLVDSMQFVGKESKHLKVSFSDGNKRIDAIAFNFDNLEEIVVGDEVNIAYSITNNVWNGRSKIELKLKEIARV